MGSEIEGINFMAETSNIKMIALDLDGTLLRDDETVSQYTANVLERCREKGIKIIYATVRGTVTDSIVLPDIFDGYVRLGGAVAYCGTDTVYSKLMPINHVRDFLITLHGQGLQVAARDDGTHYANFNVSDIWPWLTNYKIIKFEDIELDVEKIYAITETPEAVNIVRENLPSNLHLFVSRDDLTFVTHEDAIKSKAISAIAQTWGINQSEIVGFGDDLIDIEMLQYCGVGVAMENALPEVKTAADFICGSNENDGVAKWLEENVL